MVFGALLARAQQGIELPAPIQAHQVVTTAYVAFPDPVTSTSSKVTLFERNSSFAMWQ
jgi:hypothetical protein